MQAARRRGARAALALLAGLIVGGGLGGGAVWFFNRDKLKVSGPPRPALATAEELDLVPADAVAFAHLRVAEVWHTEALAPFRKLIDKAGPEAFKVLNEEFVPA